VNDVLLRRVFPRDAHHVAGLHEAIRDQLPATGRILDLGCGINTDLEGYRTREREVWGADFQAHADLRHADWFRLLGRDGTITFPSEHFDLVVAVMVLEHVVNPRTFLSEVARVLKPGGHFIGHTISGTHYVTFIRRLVGLLPHTINQRLVRKLYGRNEVDTFPAFYRLNTRPRLKRFASAAGLEIEAIRRYADPGYFRFARPLESAAILADRILDWLAPGWGRLYLTAVIKKPILTRPVSRAA
jgi:SAM-dependent methyltransferase